MEALAKVAVAVAVPVALYTFFLKQSHAPKKAHRGKKHKKKRKNETISEIKCSIIIVPPRDQHLLAQPGPGEKDIRCKKRWKDSFRW